MTDAQPDLTHSPHPSASADLTGRPARQFVGLFALLFVVSGGCGLIYEVVWSQLMIRVMGGTTFAITTVLVAFMGGLGLGSRLGGRMSKSTAHPARVYGLFEIAIGLYALVLPALLTAVVPFYKSVYPLVSSHFLLLTMMRFVISGILLAVPTVLMGATLPLLIEHGVRSGAGVGRSSGWMFATNTMGAVLGVASAGYVLIPMWGLSRTTMLAAALNVTVGLIAILLAKKVQPTCHAKSRKEAGSVAGNPETWRQRRPSATTVTLIVFALSGAAAMIYQVVWTRVLVPHLGPHTFSFTCVLCAFILGLALGGAAAARWADRAGNPLYVLGLIETVVAVGGLIIAVVLDVFPVAARRIAGTLHADPVWMLAAQFIAVTILLLAPTFALGMIYPIAVRIVAGRSDQAGHSAGRAYAANTIGAIIGSFVAGFVLIPLVQVGLHGAMLIAVAIHAGCGLVMLFYSAVDGLKALPALPVALGICALPGWWYVPQLQQIEFAQASYMVRDPAAEVQDHQVLFYREGVDATVVVTRQSGFKSLLINNKADGSSSIADSTTQLLAGHLPMLMAKRPRDVLVVGWGTGMTAGAVSLYDSVKHIDAVELSGAVIEANQEFADVNYAVRNDPRLNLIQQDGRNHLLLTDKAYDVIISEPSNPWVAGMANLFTKEYYESCRDHLGDDGVFLAWMHSYSVDVKQFRSILRTVAVVMPHVTLWGYRGDFMMVCSKRPQRTPMSTWLERFNVPRIRNDLKRIGYDHPAHVLGMYIGDRDLILEWTAGAPLHVDDHPRAQYSGVWAMLNPHLAETQISEPLGRIAQAPFGVIVPDSSNAAQKALMDDIEKVRSARQMLRIAIAKRRNKEVFESLRLLWNAYQLWPHDRSIWGELELTYTMLSFQRRENSTEANAFLDRIQDHMPPPTSEAVDPVTPLHASGDKDAV